MNEGDPSRLPRPARSQSPASRGSKHQRARSSPGLKQGRGRYRRGTPSPFSSYRLGDSDNESGYVEHELLRSISNEHFALTSVSTQTEHQSSVHSSSQTSGIAIGSDSASTQTISERYDPQLFDIMATDAARSLSHVNTELWINGDAPLLLDHNNGLSQNERELIDQDCTVGLTDCAKTELKNSPSHGNRRAMEDITNSDYQPVQVNVTDGNSTDYAGVPAYINGERVTNHTNVPINLTLPDEKLWLTSSTDNLSSHTVRRQVEIVEHEVNQVRHVIKPNTSLHNNDQHLTADDAHETPLDLSNDSSRRRRLPVVPRSQAVPKLLLDNATKNATGEQLVTDDEGTNADLMKPIHTTGDTMHTRYARPMSSIRLNPSDEANEQKPTYLQDYHDYMESFDGTDTEPFGHTGDHDNADATAYLEDSVFLHDTPLHSATKDNATSQQSRPHTESVRYKGNNKETLYTNEPKHTASAVHTQNMEKIFVNITSSPNGEHSRSVTTIRQRGSDLNEPATNLRDRHGQASSTRDAHKGTDYRDGRPKSVPTNARVGTTGTDPPWRYNRQLRVATRDANVQTLSHHATQTPLRVQVTTSANNQASLLDTFVFESDCNPNSSQPIAIMPWNVIDKDDLDDMNASKDFSTQTFGQPENRLVVTGTQTMDAGFNSKSHHEADTHSTKSEKQRCTSDSKKSGKSKKHKKRDTASNAPSKSHRGDILKYMLSQVRELRNELVPNDDDPSPEVIKKSTRGHDRKKKSTHPPQVVDSDSAIDSLDEDPDKYTKRRLELLYKSRNDHARRSPERPSERPSGRLQRRHSVENTYYDDRHDDQHSRRDKDHGRGRYRDDYNVDMRGRRMKSPPRRAMTPPPRRGYTSPPRRGYTSPPRHDRDGYGRNFSPPHHRPMSRSYGRSPPRAPPMAYRHPMQQPPRYLSQSVPPRSAQMHLGQNAAFRPIQNQIAYQSVPPTPIVAANTPHGMTPGMTPQRQSVQPPPSGTPMVLLPSGQLGQVAPQPQQGQQPYIMIASPYRYDSEPNVEQQSGKSRGKRAKTPMEVSLHNATRAASQMKDITDNMRKKQF